MYRKKERNIDVSNAYKNIKHKDIDGNNDNNLFYIIKVSE